ncbi:MAG: hypothetical protein M3220_16880 [Chloroflexota bacterium]|nr:hypothetical protein [Chloroflexota bacterium]
MGEAKQFDYARDIDSLEECPYCGEPIRLIGQWYTPGCGVVDCKFWLHHRDEFEEEERKRAAVREIEEDD